MNKKDFATYITSRLGGLSLEKQIEELEKVQKVYLPEMILKKRQQLGTWIPPEKAKDYVLCRHCQKYYLKATCEQQDFKEVRTEITARDCMYGEDDRIGEVEYLVTYGVCPRCGGKQEIKKWYLRAICEWNRREGKSTAKYYNK